MGKTTWSEGLFFRFGPSLERSRVGFGPHCIWIELIAGEQGFEDLCPRNARSLCGPPHVDGLNGGKRLR